MIKSTKAIISNICCEFTGHSNNETTLENKPRTNDDVCQSITSYKQNILQLPSSCPSPQITTQLFQNRHIIHKKCHTTWNATLPLSMPSTSTLPSESRTDKKIYQIQLRIKVLSQNVHLQKGIAAERERSKRHYITNEEQ